jgi:RHS repeat-associated protein
VGAREYDPRTARWLQRDPIDIASGDPNLYRYCGNEPVNWTDPDGQKIMIVTCSVAKRGGDVE